MKVKFFDIARRLSHKSNHDNFKIGCVIVKKSKPVGFGFNDPRKTHPKSNTKFRTMHAELDAILGVELTDLNKSEVYVYRQHKDGTLAMSRPCIYCMQILKSVGVSKVCYSSDNGYMEEDI